MSRVPSVLIQWRATPEQQLARVLEFGDGSRFALPAQAFRIDATYQPEAVSQLLVFAEVRDGSPTVTIPGDLGPNDLVSWDGRAVLHPSLPAMLSRLTQGQGLTAEQQAQAHRYRELIQRGIEEHEADAQRQREERLTKPSPGDSLEAFQAAELPGVVIYSDGTREVVGADEAAVLERALAQARVSHGA